ncbi:hypothetical protein DSLASN_18230 [Desulfoluna limicola]|uniref:Uncharacterized protein n=1 Tax=Desulfoluna limicola TaxID=2810562 RepID=A0ABN6F2Q4_9BACT|nr:hypothetical protein DSLASN_18230 [Desulfoluna limicola]
MSGPGRLRGQAGIRQVSLTYDLSKQMFIIGHGGVNKDQFTGGGVMKGR